jgi:hypothetical protein
MTNTYAVGTTVSWQQGNRTFAGTIRDVFPRRVTWTCDDHRVMRHGDPGNPIYLVETIHEGIETLQAHDELCPRNGGVSSDSGPGNLPRMRPLGSPKSASVPTDPALPRVAAEP